MGIFEAMARIRSDSMALNLTITSPALTLKGILVT